MRLNPHILNLPAKSRRGFSLVEMMIAIAVGVMVIGAVVSLSIIAAQNFAATANYVQMDDESRNALDQISREVRNATSLAAFSTNNPKYLRLTNTIVRSGATITNDINASTLILQRTGQADKILLKGCGSFSFQLFNRVPTTNYSFYLSTNTSGQVTNLFCKVINMNWKCSRNILGSKFQTEIVQTAQVVMRNQVSH